MAFDLKKVFSNLQPKKIIAPTKVVGIDFGSSSLKIVELEKKEGSIILSTYGELQLGPYIDTALGASVKLPLQKKVEALVDAFREAGVTAKDGVFAVPLSESFITVMSLAASADEDIAPRVNVEARKYIPVPITDVVLEWSEVTSQETDVHLLAREVLLVALQNQSVADNKTLLDAITMTSRTSEIELFSSMRALIEAGDDITAIIDLGAGMSKLYIVNKGILQKIHRVPQGGFLTSQALSTQLQIALEDAENLKRSVMPGDERFAVIQKSIEHTLARPLTEFKRVIEQFEIKTNMHIARIVLTGGVVSSDTVMRSVAYTLGREVEKAVPFKKVVAPAFLSDTLESIGPSFATALGAALRQFE
jgi:type IV pilus assembly protein PilM